MTWTRHENGAGATPTFGRRRADQLRSAAAASATCRRRRRTALIHAQHFNQQVAVSFLPEGASWFQVFGGGTDALCVKLSRHSNNSTVSYPAVRQLKPKVAQTVQRHCLVWIYLDTQDMFSLVIFSWMFTIACRLVVVGLWLGLWLDLVSGWYKLLCTRIRATLGFIVTDWPLAAHAPIVWKTDSLKSTPQNVLTKTPTGTWFIHI